jgi:hypothetical protein
MTASRTRPTALVLVITMGPSTAPDSSTQWIPVISPFPFIEKYPPRQGCRAASPFPRGRIAVTPVRTESPSISVV